MQKINLNDQTIVKLSPEGMAKLKNDSQNPLVNSVSIQLLRLINNFYENFEQSPYVNGGILEGPIFVKNQDLDNYVKLDVDTYIEVTLSKRGQRIAMEYAKYVHQLYPLNAEIIISAIDENGKMILPFRQFLEIFGRYLPFSLNDACYHGFFLESSAITSPAINVIEDLEIDKNYKRVR